MGRVIEEVPDVVEVVAGASGISGVVEVGETSDLTTEFDGVVAFDFGGYIFVGVGPLIEVGWPREAEGLKGIGLTQLLMRP